MKSASPAKQRDKFVEENLGLVHACAGRFRGRGVEYDDLYQAGCMGLIKACDGFDPSLGYKFSTYAVPVILGEIKRLFRDGGAVKVSRSLKEVSLKVARQRELMTHQRGEEPTITELSQALGIEEEKIVEAIGIYNPTVSLTAGDETGQTIDIPVPCCEEKITDSLSLREVVGRLEPVERQIVVLRYFQEKTQADVGKALSMTQVQVSRREKKILSRLREMLAE